MLFPNVEQCCAISPFAALLASGLIDGRLQMHTFSSEPSGLHSQPAGLVTAHASGHSCRALTFIHEGNHVVTWSSDQSLALFDASAANLVWIGVWEALWPGTSHTIHVNQYRSGEWMELMMSG